MYRLILTKVVTNKIQDDRNFLIVFLRSVVGRTYDCVYLVGTPVPHGRDGQADGDAGPRQVRIVSWPEEVIAIGRRHAALGVRTADIICEIVFG